MPRVNVEEVRVRIDDCWDKDNGQYYSIEFGNKEIKVPDVSKASYEDQCATFQELIRKNKAGEVSFRITRLGDITHLESAGEKRSTAGLFPECFTGVDSTDPETNGTLGTEYDP